MSRALLYTVNSTAQTLAAGGNVNFGSAVRRFGQCIKVSGTTINLEGAGYYEVDANLTIVGTAAGTATVQLYANGAAIPGATASVTTADGDSYPVSIQAIVREYCACNGPVAITMTVNGIATEISNVAVIAEKL